MLLPDVSIERGGILLEPDPTDDREAGGILNPAVAGNYLLYRAVARGNYSRIMAAELSTRIEDTGPRVVARKMGRVVLNPQEPYEVATQGRGGIEDPRVTQLPDGQYVMFYIGYGRAAGFRRQTPVVAVATSTTGLDWERNGRVTFAPHRHGIHAIDFNLIPNKDTVLFAEKIGGRFAMLHRPMFSHEQALHLQVPRRGIWYAESDTLIGPWDNHQLLVAPQYAWENGGVGAGIPPLHLHGVWMHIYHGFTQRKADRTYSAGFFVTPHNEPTHIIHRSAHAILEPRLLAEQEGVVERVVFPTAVWGADKVRGTMTIIWGAADTRIMWGTVRLPADVLQTTASGQHGDE